MWAAALSVDLSNATAYGGLTMLEMIAASRHQELFALTARSFDFAAAA